MTNQPCSMRFLVSSDQLLCSAPSLPSPASGGVKARSRYPPETSTQLGFGVHGGLEHDPEKWEPVFGKDHAPTISWSGMTIRRKVIPLQAFSQASPALQDKMSNV